MISFKIIIQARMTSSRLPAKVMLPLCGKSVLEVMLERLQRFKENIIIATTDDGTQTPIVELCKDLQINYVEGDSDHVLARYYKAALKFDLYEDDIIVRLTSDCPLIDPKIVQETIRFFQNSDAEYVCACQNSGFPRGMDTEVFRVKHLREAYLNATSEYEKEHVTPYIKKHFKCSSFKNPTDHSKYRLTLDESDDYKAIVALYDKLSCRNDFSYAEMITILEQNPQIYELNKHVEQKNYPHTH